MKHKKAFLAVLLSSILFVGCISAATIASYLPIFEAAINGVLALAAPNASAAVSADEAKVNASVATLVQAVQGVQGAPSVSAALGVVETSATQLEGDLQLTGQDSTDAKLAIAILDLSIGTYQAIIANHAVTSTTAMIMFSAPGQRRFATSAGDFKRQFNTLCKQYGHPEMQMKLTVAEHLHIR